jgi:hypothetical protein
MTVRDRRGKSRSDLSRPVGTDRMERPAWNSRRLSAPGEEEMRKSIMIIATAGVLALALAPAAVAKTTPVPVNADEALSEVVAGGSSAMHGKTLSVRDAVWVTTVTGNDLLAGTDMLVINYELNTVTGSGALWGTNVIEPSAYPDGRFDCSWIGIFDDFVWTGRTVCHGAGSLAGWQLRLAILAEPGGQADVLDGYAFLPGH